MTVNPSTMRMGIAAILVGLVGAFGVRSLLDEEEPVIAEAAPNRGLIPVAIANLDEGRVIRRSDMAMVPMSLKEMEEKGWNPSLVMTGEDFIIGRTLRKRVPQGDPFYTHSVYLQGEEPDRPPRPGFRAAQVTVSLSSGGHVKPGDIVDLHFTSEEKDAERGKPAIPSKTIKVASAVRVLREFRPQISELQNVIGYRAKPPVFTLEVTPTTATNINTLTPHGSFSMIERPDGDIALSSESDDAPKSLLELLGIEEPQPPPPTHGIFVTEYYRGRSRNAMQFPVPLGPNLSDDEEKLLEQYRALKKKQQEIAQAGGVPPQVPASGGGTAAPPSNSVVSPPTPPQRSGLPVSPPNSLTPPSPVPSTPAASPSSPAATGQEEALLLP